MRASSSVRTIFVVRTPRTDAGIDGTEAMVMPNGISAAGDLFVLDQQEQLLELIDDQQHLLVFDLPSAQRCERRVEILERN